MPTIDELLVRIDAQTEGLRRELARADRAVASSSQNIERHVSRIDRAMSGVGVVAGRLGTGLIAAFGAGELARDILGTVTQFEKLDVRLRRLTGSEAAYAEAQGYLRETAQRFSVDLASLTDQYGQLLTLQNSGLITQDQARALLEGFGDVAAATGASTNQLNQVMFGLSQALSSGVVRAEELNQVTEPLPGLMQKLDEASGQAAGGFRRLVVDGKVTSEMFATTLVRALESYRGAAEATADTVGAAWVRLGNSWTELKRTLGGSLADPLAGFIDNVNRGIRRLHGLAQEEISVQVVAANKELVEAQNILAELQRRADSSPAYARALTQQTAAAQAQVDRLQSRVDGLLDQARAHAKRVDELEGRAQPERARKAADFTALQQEMAKARELAQTLARQDIRLQDFGKKGKSDAEKEAEREAKAIAKVVEALQFQEAQLGRTAQQEAIYSALQSAGITENHKMAGAVADAAIALQQMEDQLAAVDGELDRLINLDKSGLFDLGARFKIDSEIQREIDANAELVAALAESEEAYRVQVRLQEILARYKAAGIDLTAEEIAKARELAIVLADQDERLQKTSDDAREFGLAISTAFEDAVLEGEKLNDVLGSLLRTIGQIVLRRTVTRPMEEGIGGIIDSIAKGIGGWLGGGGSPISLGGFSTSTGGFSSAGSFAPGGFAGLYADGGYIPGGKWGIAGEAGPEIVRGPAMVTPHVPSMAMLRQGGGAPDGPPIVNITVDARGAQMGVAEQIDRRLSQVIPRAISTAVARTRDARLRNPLFLEG